MSAALNLNPNIAAAAIVAGFLGIYAEFCRPGQVIPGVLGASLVLMGMASMARFPLTASGVLLILLAVLLLAIQSIVPARALLTLAAAAALMAGLKTLIASPDPALRIGWATASSVTLVLTCSTAFLLTVATAARRAKALSGKID